MNDNECKSFMQFAHFGSSDMVNGIIYFVVKGIRWTAAQSFVGRRFDSFRPPEQRSVWRSVSLFADQSLPHQSLPHWSVPPWVVSKSATFPMFHPMLPTYHIVSVQSLISHVAQWSFNNWKLEFVEDQLRAIYIYDYVLRILSLKRG